MQKIHILGNKNGCYTSHLHPLRVFRNELMDAGLDVRYFWSPSAAGLDECDVLVFLEAQFRGLLPVASRERSALLDYLEAFFKRFPRVVWFDGSDSSGMLRTYIFPLVDAYAKSQVLQRVQYYQEEHLTGVLHRDYVHESYYVDDSSIFKGPATPADLKKLRIGWNFALCNWSFRNTNLPIDAMLIRRNRRDYIIKYTVPNLAARRQKVCYRVSTSSDYPTVAWWRSRTRQALEEAEKSFPDLGLRSDGSVDKSRYLQEMRKSIVSPSPFGIGEICYRDFESFFCGSLLLKPGMDHLQTWPDLYVEGETYVSHEWDFSDFTDKLASILSSPGRYEDVAREGQRRFREALSDGRAFAAHFKSMVTG